MKPFAKTTGSKGVHVYVAVKRDLVQHDVWAISKEIGYRIARTYPSVLTAEYRVAKRPERHVLVDYNQNAWGRTLASIYSVRANETAAVSTPLTWEELEAGCEIGDFTIFNVPERVAKIGDLWKAAASAAADLAWAMSRFENLPLRPPVEPMETRQVQSIPQGAQWSYEPKWDGFRCMAFRDGNDVELQSKSGETLTRYFPEIVEALRTAKEQRFVTDGELMIVQGETADFDALLQRIHPAESRVRKLAKETPASYALFDLLVEGRSELFERPLTARREALESFVVTNFSKSETVRLSPATTDAALAKRWLAGSLATRRRDRQARRSVRLRQPRCGREDKAQLYG